MNIATLKTHLIDAGIAIHTDMITPVQSVGGNVRVAETHTLVDIEPFIAYLLQREIANVALHSIRIVNGVTKVRFSGWK